MFLNPGLVGLSIIDAFVIGLPIFTTDCKLHSPEIAYLEPSRNGFITATDLNEYVTKVVHVLGQPDLLHDLSENCRVDARKYSIDNMARNFTQGLNRALTKYSLGE